MDSGAAEGEVRKDLSKEDASLVYEIRGLVSDLRNLSNGRTVHSTATLITVLLLANDRIQFDRPLEEADYGAIQSSMERARQLIRRERKPL